jgi:multidrug efflux pump subunit AcrA (membrane-fusion protein)
VSDESSKTHMIGIELLFFVDKLKKNTMPKEIFTENINTIQLLSTDVQEIISYKPHWIVQNGSLLFLLIIASLISISFFVRYPDVVNAPAVFTSINAPKQVNIKVDGRLVMLMVKEGEKVNAHKIIGYMESIANHNQVIELNKVVDSMKGLLQQLNTIASVALLDSFLLVQNHINVSSDNNLGELQQAHQIFMQSFYLFKQYLNKGFFLTKKNMLQADILFLQRQHQILQQQKALQLQDVGLSKETIEANSILKNEKVISALDFRNEKSKYIAKQLSIPQINTSIVANESSRHEKQKEIEQLNNEIEQQENIFVQSLNTFCAKIEEWKSKYVLVSPIAGIVSFVGFMQQNQQLKVGQILCYINPSNTEYFAEVIIPQHNFGKINLGQQVLLKLQAYPYQEFGILKGVINQINTLPSDSGFTAKIKLPNGFTSSYKKQLQFKEGLKASAEIITSNRKLSTKLFDQFNSLQKN